MVWVDDVVSRLSGHVNELATAYLHAEAYHTWAGRNRSELLHIVRHPCLLDQLRELCDPANSTPTGEPVSGSGPASRPAANLDAVDLLIRIGQETLWWMAEAAITPRPHVEANLHALVGYAAGLTEPKTLTALARDVAGWHRRAQVVCGWRPPAYAPDVSCPHPTCGAPPRPGSGLRIGDDGQAAWCLSCDASWDHTTIAELADHVAREGAWL